MKCVTIQAFNFIFEHLDVFKADKSKIILPGQTHGTILFRKALSDGQDPSLVAAKKIRDIIME